MKWIEIRLVAKYFNNPIIYNPTNSLKPKYSSLTDRNDKAASCDIYKNWNQFNNFA